MSSASSAKTAARRPPRGGRGARPPRAPRGGRREPAFEHQWEAGGSALYIRLNPPFGGRVRVHTETYAVGPTQTTECRKAGGHPRRKCPLCDADAARA